jgi:hypothetical protein
VDFLHIHAKNPDYRGCFGSLQGIKIHFREFLYYFALKRNKLLDGRSPPAYVGHVFARFPLPKVCLGV